MMCEGHKKVISNPGRRTLLNLAKTGLKEVTPEACLSKFVRINGNILYVNNRKFDIKDRRIFVIGAGKASAAMAVELEKILGLKRITAGVVISNERYFLPKKIKFHLADHPLPTVRGLRGTEKILDLKERFSLTENDLIIALVSGGGSALMPSLLPGIKLQEKRCLSDVLLKSGANGYEFIKIKRRVSGVKGGKLALYFAPTPIIALVCSDNVRNDLSVIAAGPFCQDKTGIKEVKDIISKYKIHKKIPASMVKYLVTTCDNKPQTAKDFKHVFHTVIADNNTLVDSIKKAAIDLGIRVFSQKVVEGEAKDVAFKICSSLAKRKKIGRPSLFLYGGETVVTLKGKIGLGGRNQEFVLACLDYIKKNHWSFPRNWTLVSVASDGRDFIAESAGAIADEISLKEILRKKMIIAPFLKKHNSFVFLKKINSILRFDRPTGTNVCDIMMFLFK